MEANRIREQLAFEDSLEVGQRVEFRWTNSGRYFSAPVKLTKINEKSLRGELLTELTAVIGTYPKGWSIVVPRFADLRRWSANNGAFPILPNPRDEAPDDLEELEAAEAIFDRVKGQNS